MKIDVNLSKMLQSILSKQTFSNASITLVPCNKRDINLGSDLCNPSQVISVRTDNNHHLWFSLELKEEKSCCCYTPRVKEQTVPQLAKPQNMSAPVKATEFICVPQLVTRSISTVVAKSRKGLRLTGWTSFVAFSVTTTQQQAPIWFKGTLRFAWTKTRQKATLKSNASRWFTAFMIWAA